MSARWRNADRLDARRAPPPQRTRSGRARARGPCAARPRRPRGCRRRGAAARRARARRPRRAGRARRAAAAATRRARRARSAGRSRSPPCASPAGARLTVTRPPGNSSSADMIPLRTRCRASAHARSGRPTITNAGMPFVTSASTSTRRGSRPTSACVTARASTLRRYGGMRDGFLPASSAKARDEHVFEVLAGATARAAVHVAAQARLELEARAVEDLGIEIAAVVDDDEHAARRARAPRPRSRAPRRCPHGTPRAQRATCPPRRRRARARAGRRGRAARTRSGAARGSRSAPDTAAT